MDQQMRTNLDQIFDKYISDTFTYIHKAKKFCDSKMAKWCLQREKDVEKMRDIQNKANKIKTKITIGRRKQLEKDLGDVLEGTLEGLGKLQSFLDAVEKLAVTSAFVFTDDCWLNVRSVIFAARMVAPLLIHFKRDNYAFFVPTLNNVEVLAYQLEKYISVSQQICEGLETRETYCTSSSDPCSIKLMMLLKKSSSVESSRWQNSAYNIKDTEDIWKMLDHLNQLDFIRTNQDVRLTVIFQKSALSFIGLFNQRQSRMRQFLSDAEESAVQLDKMKFGANISSVAGSSVGVVGGALSIAGLALAPMTAGVSLALTLSGVGLGVTSAVNSLVTGITELAVNNKHGTDAQNIFQSFMEDVQKLGDCLEMVGSSEGPAIAFDEMDVAAKAVIALGNGIDGLVDGASAVTVLQAEEALASAVKLGLQEAKAGRNIPNLAADLPDIGQIAKGTPLAMSKATRSGFIALNALFIGLDVFCICKDSISLSKGSKNEIAQLIRSKTALWRSELDSWEKMHESLCRGIWRFRRSQTILEQPFYQGLTLTPANWPNAGKTWLWLVILSVSLANLAGSLYMTYAS